MLMLSGWEEEILSMISFFYCCWSMSMLILSGWAIESHVDADDIEADVADAENNLDDYCGNADVNANAAMLGRFFMDIPAVVVESESVSESASSIFSIICWYWRILTGFSTMLCLHFHLEIHINHLQCYHEVNAGIAFHQHFCPIRENHFRRKEYLHFVWTFEYSSCIICTP